MVRKVCIDVDDTVVDFTGPFLEFWNGRYGTGFTCDDILYHNLWLTLGGTRDDLIAVVREFYATPEHGQLVPIPHAREGLIRLAASCEVHALTARSVAIREETRAILERHFAGAIREVHCTNAVSVGEVVRTKPDMCRELGMDVIVEDRAECAIECAQIGIPAIVLDRPWNRKGIVLDPRLPVVRAADWREVVAIIESMNPQG